VDNRSRWRNEGAGGMEIDCKAGRVIWGFLAPGSAVDAEREELRVQAEAVDRAAKTVI
jgi:hypothetical protein